MSNSSGSKISGSDARYLPFGAYRTTPTTNPSITDRGFTGQKHNNSLGLIYYNARFYVPYINRFISADTLVPQPTSPQSFNRFAYVRNNPLGFIDPTGHREIEIDGGGGGPDVRLPILTRDEAVQALKSLGKGAVTLASLLPGVGDAVDVYDFGISVSKGQWAQAGTIAGMAILPGSARTLRGAGGEIVEGVARYGDDLARFAPVKPRILAEAIDNFNPRTFSINGEGFHLSRDGMEHILGRHHPNYWQGDIKRMNSALDASLSVDEVADLAQQTIQNGYSSRTLLRSGSYRYVGTVNGNRYKVVVGGPRDHNALTGHIVEFTPFP